MNLQPGETVGPYEIVAPVGAGGMGEVYRARDNKLDREIALKILPANLATSAEHLRRFEQEARAASALNHPNIVTIYDVGRAGPIAFIAMELIDGADLRTTASREKLALKHLIRIISKVAEGLAAAHERGIIHRDLKPENILVSRDGFVKLVDFGLAKLVRPFSMNDVTVPHTSPGAVFGTTGYMSPEQAAGKDTDFRSDQFSLGVIVFELLTGRRPFDRDTAVETLAAILRDDPPPLLELNDSVPVELARVVDRCLQKEPRDRYASTRDLARDLRDIRESLSSTSPPPRRSTPPARRSRRRGAMIAAAGVAAILVTGGGWLGWKSWRTPSGPAVRSLGVIRFSNLSGAPDGQLFADGIRDTVMSRIAQSKTIRVAPVADADAGEAPAEVARRSRADLLLKGSVQRSQNEVRVSWALIDPRSGDQIAGDTVTGAAAEVFELEDLLADRVRQALRLDAPQQRATAASIGLTSAADQTAYLEAVGLLTRARDEKAVDRAIGKLEPLLLNSRDSARLNGELARALMMKYEMTGRRNFLDEASVYADRAVKLDPTVPQVHVALGNVRAAAGRREEALASFERALVLQPNLAEASLGIANAYAAMGRAADAEREYQRVIDLRPDWPTAFNRYGGFCFRRGKYEQAASLYRRVVTLLPDSARGYTNLGAALQGQGKYDEALVSYERASAVAPSAIAFSNIGTLHFYLGRYAEACAAFEKASQLAPNDALVWMNLADAYRWAPGRREQAKAAYAKAVDAARARLAIDARDAVAIATIALCTAKSGNAAAASTQIRAALEMDPTDAVVLYDAAIVAQLRNDPDAALSWLRRAVDNGYPTADTARDPELTSLRDRAEFKELIQRKSSS